MSNENDSARGADSGKRVSVAMSNTDDAAAAAHGNFWKALWRTKNYSSVMHTPLHRCFSTFDLTLFSIGKLFSFSDFLDFQQIYPHFWFTKNVLSAVRLFGLIIQNASFEFSFNEFLLFLEFPKSEFF